MYFKSRIAVVLVVLCCLAQSACTNVHHGYYFSPRKEHSIEIGKTTRAQMQSLLGSPTFTNEPVNDTIFYADELGVSFMFVRELTESRRILGFRFNKQGILVDATQYSLADSKEVIMHNIDVQLERPNPYWAVPFYTLF